MNHRKPLILLLIIIFLLLSLPVYSGAASQTITARLPLPHVSPEMEKPQYWFNKIKNPGHPLLKPEEIQIMNKNNLKRKDLYLFSLPDLQEELSKEELTAINGIGPVIAERIIAGRPYKDTNDLLRVKGIGKAKLEKIRPYFKH